MHSQLFSVCGQQRIRSPFSQGNLAATCNRDMLHPHRALVKSHGSTLVSHRFQVGSLSPRAQLLMPANSFLGAFGMFSIVLKMSSRSAFGLTIFPPLVGMPLMGAKRLQKQKNVAVQSYDMLHVS